MGNKSSMHTVRYIGYFDRGWGPEAIEIGLDYPFACSGVLTPPTLRVQIERGISTPPHYQEVPLLAVRDRREASHSLGILFAGKGSKSPSRLSRSLTRHKEVQKRLGRLR